MIRTRRSGGVGRAAVRLAVPALLGLPACLEPDPPPGPPDGTCTSARDCSAGEHCVGGFCTPGGGDVDVEASPTPVFVWRTESIRFRDVGRGRREIRPLRIANLGDGNLEISRVEAPGAAGRLAITPEPQGFILVVPPLGEYTFSLAFTGTDGVAFSSPLTLHTNDPINPRPAVPVVVEYSGRPELIATLAADGQHAEDLADTVIDLGPIPEGLTGRTRLYVKNLGIGGMYAVFEPPHLFGDPAFAISAAPAPDGDGRHRLGRFAAFCAETVDCVTVGGSCVDRVCVDDDLPFDTLALDLEVALVAGATATTEVRLPYAAPNGVLRDELRLGVTARGAPADLYLEPMGIDFGAVSLGFPQSALVRAYNLASEPLVIEEVAVSGPGAATPSPVLRVTLLDGALPHEVAPLGEALLRVDFVPSSGRLGETDGQVEVRVRERPDRVYTVALAGRARIGPVLATMPLADLFLGTTHVRRPRSGAVLLANVGPVEADPLIVSATAATVRSGFGALTVSPPEAIAPIAAGASAQLVVECIPFAVGSVEGRITLATDAPDNPVRSLAVSCAGVDPELRVSFQSREATTVRTFSADEIHACRGDPMAFPSPCMDFGDLYVSRQTTLSMTLGNEGQGPLTIERGDITQNGSAFAWVSDPWPVHLAAGTSTELSLRFQGSVVAALEEGRVTLVHDDDDRGPVEFSLVGSTAACSSGTRDCSASLSCQDVGTAAACCRSPADPDACLIGCTPCPAKSHASRSCVSDACVYACVSGWFDLNGNGDGTGGPVDDGCEYGCVPSPAGTEVCDRADNDCDGLVDEGLTLTDGLGAELPATCTPGSAIGFLGTFDEDDLGVVVPGESGAYAPLVTAVGRVYREAGSPDGDVDWLRLVIAEEDACAATAFRLGVTLEAPAGTQLELCARLQDPAGSPPFSLPCDDAGGPVFDTCAPATATAPATLWVEWPESCGAADSRVLDLRVRAEVGATGIAAYACEPYWTRIIGATLR